MKRSTSLASSVAVVTACLIARAQTRPALEVVIATTAPASSEPTRIDAKPMGPWGFDVTGMNPAVKPGDNFAEYASGAWMKRTEIPADRASYGAFAALWELSELRVRGLLEDLQRTSTTLPSEATPATAERVKLAGLFASYLDEAEVERRDATPIAPRLAAVRAVATPRDVATFMGRAQGTLAGGGAPFGVYVGADPKHPTFNTLMLGQGGLGLPEREYYLNPIYAAQKARYQQYVAQMLEMIGWDDPAGAAERIVAFEAKLAAAHWTRAQERDVERTYNPMPIRRLIEQAPGFDWQAYLDAAGVGATSQVVVSENTAMPQLVAALNETPLATWQAWQAFKVVDEAAPLLSRRFVDAAFEFHGKFMSGSPQMRDRAKRAASFCQEAMGEAIGREYVAKYFPPEAKAKAESLVNDVRAAMRARIERVDWMSPETRARAVAKLDKLTVKIGYPDKWRDYSTLIVDPGDLFGNAARAQRFNYEYRVAKLAQRVDKQEWGMTPQTTNAYYNGEQNEIVFPAAILQPPFFEADADAAVNYGGIGAVIGHEITHGFDDQGRKSDGDGVLSDWWTADDSKRFDARAAELGKQFEAYDFPSLPGSHINGAGTMGENIADLGGVLNAIDAYHLHLAGRPAPVLDGFTGDQRVFLSWAQVWRTLVRDAALKQALATDAHSPGTIRAFAPLRNVDAWYDAFGVKPGDKNYLPPEKRVRIW